MLITRESDYALRMLRALADGRILTAGELEEQEELPQKFAYKILKKLQKAGYVSSCMTPGYTCEWCGKKGTGCIAHGQLAQIQKVINDDLRSRDLQTLLFG